MDYQEFEYRGYNMRSHSETRWASMMDYLGIRWLYEPKVYRTRHGGYLPDFYLPDARCFLEVKGPTPTHEEVDKARDLEESTGMPVVFAYGAPKLDGVYLGEGYLQRGNLFCTTYQVCEWLAKIHNEQYAIGFAVSGRRRPAPSCISIGDAVEQFIIGKMGRSYVENMRKEQHAPLNEAKLKAFYVPTIYAAISARLIRAIRETESVQQGAKR